MRFSFSLLALAAAITSSFAALVDNKAPSSSYGATPKATCSYINKVPVAALLSDSSKFAAVECFEQMCEAERPFSKLPTSANCGGRNWSIKTPTAGYEDFFTNTDCAKACNTCIRKGVEKGYRHAQCDVTIEGVFGSICRVYYNDKA